jgi:hypothetical protein
MTLYQRIYASKGEKRRRKLGSLRVYLSGRSWHLWSNSRECLLKLLLAAKMFAGITDAIQWTVKWATGPY